MGKRIISQARGKGSLTYRVRRKAYSFRISFPRAAQGSAEIVSLIHSAGHSAPLMKLTSSDGVFYLPAFNTAFVGQKISFGGEAKTGNILELKDIPPGTEIYNIENNPRDGGKFMRAAGTAALVSKKLNGHVLIAMPNKKELTLNENSRAIVGRIAGSGRALKPWVKAGRKHYLMKSRNKLWPRTSAIKTNAIDHPFGSGRGKRAKPKIAKRNAPPGRRVGHLRPRRTGYVR